VDAWLSDARDEIARAAGLEPGSLALTEADVSALLELARIAAHDSGERTNAPLLCYLVGRAQAAGEASLADLADAVKGVEP
jgi:Domain of unknown function (DUF6457)